MKNDKILELIKKKNKKGLITTRYHTVISNEIQTDDETDNRYFFEIYQTDDGYIWDIVLTDNFTGEETHIEQEDIPSFAQELNKIIKL